MSTKLNVILYRGTHDVLATFEDQFITYLEGHDIDYYVVKSGESETYCCKEFNDFSHRENVIVFSFNNSGTGLKEKGINYWGKYNIPFFDFIVDHPRYFFDTLDEVDYDLYVIALDRNHIDYIKRWYKDVKDVFFLPNGGTEYNSTIPYKDRKIDVIYMGECQRPISEYLIIPFFEDQGREFYQYSIAKMRWDTSLTVEKVIDMYFEETGKSVTKENLKYLNEIIATYLENTIRRITKLAGMKALDNAGVHVDIYGGDGWYDDEIRFSDNIVIQGRVPIDELPQKICDAKISLCFTPWFKRGCSEKNFDSMLNGALCVSDKTEYLEEHYTDGYNIVYFDLSNPEQMAADIKWLLENDDKAEIIAKRGYETAARYDRWFNRFDYIIEKMHEVLKERNT